MNCTHPDHNEYMGCGDRAVGCSPECECCKGALQLRQLWFLETRNFHTYPEAVYFMFGHFYPTIEAVEAARNKLAQEQPSMPIRVSMEWMHPKMAELYLQWKAQ